MDYPVFFNQTGRHIAWLDDDSEFPTIYLFDGTPVAWIADGVLYDHTGAHLGWYESGWLRDPDGDIVFFSTEAVGAPVKPIPPPIPTPTARAVTPLRNIKTTRPPRPVYTLNWSTLSDESFFTA